MTSFLARPGPRWFTIPPHRPFAADLARGVLEALKGRPPEALADVVLLTPTRRAGREVAHAFLEAGVAKAALLPQVRPLGDLDEGEPPFEPGEIALDLPPAIAPARRRFELTRLVKANEDALGLELSAPAALTWADALGRFLDSWQIEECAEPDRIDGLAGEFAVHWERSARFLRIVLSDWPRRLEALGLIDPAARRVRLLNALAQRWEDDPPDVMIIAAGSTGTAKSTSRVLRAIAHAPNGCVVLPGLDTSLPFEAWREMDDQHPQSSMKRLMTEAGVNWQTVPAWPQSGEFNSRARWRQRVINEALRPAEQTADWLNQIGKLRDEGKREKLDPVAEGMKGLSLVQAKSEEEAAAVAALLLRETLETDGATAALITPDINLARRVSARLARWGVEADSSAGSPLAACPAAVLATLCARAAHDPAEPINLLAILKSPLVRLGWGEDRLSAALAILERAALRGARPRTWESLTARLGKEEEHARRDAFAADLLAVAHAALNPLVAAFVEGEASASDAARALCETLEAFCTQPGGGAGALWAGVAGEALSGLLAALIEDGAVLPRVRSTDFAALIERLVEGETVRAGQSAHPRLRILGAIEARLVRVDRLILAGLEEGVWPAAAPVDPFLSRPMREQLGLPPPERRIGLAAHDFAQAAAAPDVVLLRTERRGGAPAVASRWLWRLETLVRGANVKLPGREDVLAWARALDAPLAEPPPHLRPAECPAPRPPVEARPTKLGVTGIETLVRDPYAIYAQHVLGLRPLDRPAAPMEARLRGAAIHKALEAYAAAWTPDAGAAALFERLYLETLGDEGLAEAALAREQSLARRTGEWIAAFEARRRETGAAILTELQGAIEIPTESGRVFTLTAKADRIEVRERAAEILDFKTGRPPETKEVEHGYAPQLTLTAVILAEGGFTELGALAPRGLTYVRITGREPAGDEIVLGDAETMEALQAAASAGVRRLIDRYERPETPYRSRTAPARFAAKGEDYDHLARVREWQSEEDDEEW